MAGVVLGWVRNFAVVVWRARGVRNRARSIALIAATLRARFAAVHTPRPFEVELAGERFHLDASRQDLSAYASVFISREYEPDRRFRIELGATVVDVGAQVGFFTVYAGRRAGPSGRVVAVEPDPGSFSRLSRNVEVNGLHNVTLLQCAAAGHTEGVHFASKPHSVDSHVVAEPAHGTIRVDSCTLDGLVEICALTRIDYLKIDAEGAEREILRAARNALTRARVAAIEIHAPSWIDEIDELLEAAGLRKVGSRYKLHYYARS